MKFRTEFMIDLQTTKDEEMYMKKVYEIVCSIVPEEYRIGGRILDIEYIPGKRRNLVSFSWRTADDIEEGKEKPYLDSLVSSIMGVKWLRKHNVNNIAHIYL